MKEVFVRSLCAANRFAIPAGTGLLAAMVASFSPSALAQTQPGSLTLTCSAPTSTGNTADLSTAPITWGINTNPDPANPNSGWLAANSAGNGAWSTTDPAVGNHWIGANDANAPVSPIYYSLRVVASDPNIVWSSAKISYSYFVDNNVDSVSWNSTTSLPYSSSTSFTGTPYSLSPGYSIPLTSGNNTLLFKTTNGGGPYGLNANITLTFNCALPVVQTAPANAPWVLWSLSGLVLAGAAATARRRRGRAPG